MLKSVLNWIAARSNTRSEEIDYRFIADSSNDVMIMCDEEGIASYVSPSSLDLLGVEPEAILGKSHLSYVLPDDLPLLDAARAEHSTGKIRARATFRMMHKSGDIVWVEGSARAVKSPKTNRIYHAVLLRDVSERKALEVKLAALAATDGLTGLANRRAFDESLEVEWRRAWRTQTRLSLLMLDVDHFKSFNDRYGHPAGDDCLRAVSAAISGALRRGGDFAARFGGEEMAVLLPDTDLDGAATVAETIRSRVQALCIPHAGNPPGMSCVTVSIGVATSFLETEGSLQMPAELLQAADMALYKAKESGRNQVGLAPRPTPKSGPIHLIA